MPYLKQKISNLYQTLRRAFKLAWTKRVFAVVLIISLCGFFGSSLVGALVKGTPTRATSLSLETILTLEHQPTAALDEQALGTSYQASRYYVSEVFEAEHPFQLLGLSWQAARPERTTANLEIRLRSPRGTWSEWQPLEEDHDEASHNEASEGETQWSYLITSSSTAFQYRAQLSTENPSFTPKLSHFKFDYVQGGKPSLFKTATAELSKLVFNSNTAVISREAWGANEDYRLAKTFGYEETPPFTPELDEEELKEEPELANKKKLEKSEEGDPLLWPLEYPKSIKKIIIHHTATTEFLEDPAEAIRAIYYYHAVTRGWGDIGYNFIVAPNGQVFEGRFGGDGVVAGHARGHNTGSVGIALLGNYQEAALSGEMLKGLEGLLYQKTKLHKINPTGSDPFHGEELPNILGHRDVEKTACPGQNTFDFLPELRITLARALDAENAESNAKGAYAFKEANDRELVVLAPKEEQGLTFKLKNTGEKTWDKATYLLVTPREDADDKVTIPVDTQKRSALMNETSVAPGKTASFNMKVEAAQKAGFASFQIQPVYNGKFKTEQKLEAVFFVEKPSLAFTVVKSTAPKTLKANETAELTLTLKNEGNFAWKKTGEEAVTLEQVGTSPLHEGGTLASLNESVVKPGAEGTFTFSVQASTVQETQNLYFTLGVANGWATASSSGQITIGLKITDNTAEINVLETPLVLEPKTSKTVMMEITNTGKTTWEASQLKLTVTGPEGAVIGTPKLGFKTLKAGKTAKAYFVLTAPSKEGRYAVSINLTKGKTKLLKLPLKINFTVTKQQAGRSSSFENPIRIKLTPDEGVGDPLLTADQDFSLYDGETLLQNFKAKSRIRIIATEEAFEVTSGFSKWTVQGPVRLVPQAGGIVSVLTMKQIPAWNLNLNDNEFRGELEVRKEGEEVLLINTLSLEDYVKGIAEVSNGDPLEKVKTILVLARTYALYYTTQDEKFPGKPYDLDDDPNVSQKYLGYGFEKRSDNVAEAAEATAGLVVTYKDKVVKTPYFSKSNGVATKSAKEVWGWTNTPWLVSVPDPWCKSTAFEGHGVGLSGCGATALAEAGKNFIEIIQTYYTGVEVEAYAPSKL